MREFVRKVKTASDATAVQVVGKRHGRIEIVAHVGSAHTPAELALLEARADGIIHAGDVSLFDDAASQPVTSGGARVTRTFSGLLWDQLSAWWDHLGFGAIDDEVFKQVVLARIVEATSKLDAIRVIEDLGLSPPSASGIYRSLRRSQDHDYRGLLGRACWAHVTRDCLVGLLLYDITTLYFEVTEEDELRKSGFSKERRLEPQILLGLLVDVHGFPLAVHAFEGNKAETLTLLPMARQFAAEHGLTRLTVVADAGMMTETNLAGLEDAGFDFIIGSKTAKFPYYLDARAETHPLEARGDGWTAWWHLPVAPGGRHRNLIVQYRDKRAKLDLRNIDKQVSKASQAIAGDRPITRTRFLQILGGKRVLNQPIIARAKKLAGFKGYVTNLPLAGPGAIDPGVIIDSYHQLFEVERSFRMSKTDLKARPIFHHMRDSIEAHLTVVFAALAISRAIQDATGISIKRWRNQLKPIRTAEIQIGQHHLTIPPAIPDDIKPLLRGY